MPKSVLRDAATNATCVLARLLTLAALASACSSTPLPIAKIAPSPPPKDDGKPAEGGKGGAEHAAALEQLKSAAFTVRGDKQNSIRLPLPDADHWRQVKFWGVPSLLGFRYGSDHHAIVGVFVTHPKDPAVPSACSLSFEELAKPWIKAFEVELQHDAPQALSVNGEVVEVDSLVARSATVFSRDTYAAAYGAYPSWKGSCVIVGVAVPGRGEEERAKAVRDRFTKEVLPKVELLGTEEPKERY